MTPAATTLTATSLAASIELDFRAACAELAEARRALGVKDTPAARARVHRCASTIDAILDLGNAASAMGL